MAWRFGRRLAAESATRLGTAASMSPTAVAAPRRFCNPGAELSCRGGDEVSAARSQSRLEGPEDEIFLMSMKVEKRSSSEPISSKASPSGPPPPPRPKSSGRRKATSDLARRWCAPRAAAGAGAAGGGKPRPGGSACSGCCIATCEAGAAPRLPRCRSRLVRARARAGVRAAGGWRRKGGG